MKETISILERAWKFDSNVAKVFDKHVNQSIPHYDDLQKYITSLSEWFLKDNSTVYDLGCSTGTTILNICKKNKNRNLKIIGVDTGKKMISLARKKINVNKQKKNKISVQLKWADINKIKKFKKADLFILVLIFPFLNYENRKKILNKIYESLNPGGALIVVDKVRSNHAHFEDILTQLYFDYKLEMKLTEEEIIKKSKSLRSSMHIFDQSQNEKLFIKSKFKRFDIFFKCFNFVGYLITK